MVKLFEPKAFATNGKMELNNCAIMSFVGCVFRVAGL